MNLQLLGVVGDLRGHNLESNLAVLSGVSCHPYCGLTAIAQFVDDDISAIGEGITYFHWVIATLNVAFHVLKSKYWHKLHLDLRV